MVWDRIEKYKESFENKGEYVLYWVQSSPRIEYNYALEFAIQRSNELKIPLLLFFEIDTTFPFANERSFYFLIEGLKSFQNSTKTLGINFLVGIKDDKNLAQLSDLLSKASEIITEKGILKFFQQRTQKYFSNIKKNIFFVDTNTVIPIKQASSKEEYNAFFFRKKILSKVEKFIKPFKLTDLLNKKQNLVFKTMNLASTQEIIDRLKLDKSVERIFEVHGGEKNAIKVLKGFLQNKYRFYENQKNNPVLDITSNLSPYLHFGQISPLKIIYELSKVDKNYQKTSFFDELVVRRELSFNFCNYNPNYDNIKSLPEWAINTLTKHKSDKREYLYTLHEFEYAKTHDRYWNSAQDELRITGDMHGYMRMYWGKKVIEWTSSFKDAYNILIFLNNKYALDGRDPNSYAGISWCFGKHDRPWFERKVFGQARYMNESGLKRKIDIDKYVDRINSYTK